MQRQNEEDPKKCTHQKIGYCHIVLLGSLDDGGKEVSMF
jgi:hypothetical protein